MSPKRKCTPQYNSIQKLQKCIEHIADELVCPITRELPINPVLADDGRIYEKSAIEKWFSKMRCEGKHIPISPVTNDIISTKLLPCFQVRNNIEEIIRNGILPDEKKNAWNDLLALEKEVNETKIEARKGNVIAMVDLAFWYRDGIKNLPIDMNKSLEFFKKAAYYSNPIALAHTGIFYIEGTLSSDNVRVIDQDIPTGFMMLGQAAVQHCDYACFILGEFYSRGKYIKLDKDKASEWYRKFMRCTKIHTTEEMLNISREYLRIHDTGNDSDLPDFK
tara:strand:+ start:1730 stop:2560 length:831 start_codon:yes stop_codon:yes gene_type:complete